jgi:hypothetical protein
MIIMEKQGPNLFEVLQAQSFKMALESVCLLAVKGVGTPSQQISLLEQIHSEQLIHNSLCPTSIVLGRTLHNPCIYLIDFKFSIKLLDSKHTEILFEQGFETEGGLHIDEFSSLNKTLKMLQSKKDDLESLFYILIYLIRGGRLSSKPYERDFARKSLFELNKWKATASPESICEGLPEYFALCLRHLRAHNSHDRPNYRFLKALFLKCLSEIKFTKSYSNILAFDILKTLAEQKSKTESQANSCYKATLRSEKDLGMEGLDLDSDNDGHGVPPLLNCVKSLRVIKFKIAPSEIDKQDDEHFESESVTDKMDSLTRFPSAK